MLDNREEVELEFFIPSRRRPLDTKGQVDRNNKSGIRF